MSEHYDLFENDFHGESLLAAEVFSLSLMPLIPFFDVPLSDKLVQSIVGCWLL